MSSRTTPDGSAPMSPSGDRRRLIALRMPLRWPRTQRAPSRSLSRSRIPLARPCRVRPSKRARAPQQRPRALLMSDCIRGWGRPRCWTQEHYDVMAWAWVAIIVWPIGVSAAPLPPTDATERSRTPVPTRSPPSKERALEQTPRAPDASATPPPSSPSPFPPLCSSSWSMHSSCSRPVTPSAPSALRR